MSEDRATKLAALAAQIRACQACGLYKGTLNAVPGAGNPNSEIMFIGEGPGFNEDQQGIPFVGRSGQYLVQLLKLIGLERGDVFIANVVKHRPPENRDPLPDEIIACRAYLDQQEQIIDPLLIVTLGRFSMARYFPNGKITAIHGQAKFDERRGYLPLFHPAAVLRNPTLQEAMATDIKRIPQLLLEVKARRAAVEVANKAAEDAKPKPPPTQLSLF